jgi:hypothetical protein
MLKTRIQICIIGSISYLFAIKEKRLKTDYRINTVSDRFHPIFEMSMMGELTYFLGFQVKQLKEGIFISQTKYTQDLLKRFGMKDAKPITTPMGTNRHFNLDVGGKSIDQKIYLSKIESLLYLCASRQDIMLPIFMCPRFQSDPKECHLVAMKRILRYLVHTPPFGLWYPKGSTFDLIGYLDFDYAGCKFDRKSTLGICQFWEGP